MKKDVRPERLKELFDYAPETGVFTRRVTNRRWRAGQVAGCDDQDGYTLVNVDGTQYRAHRLAWLYVHGQWPTLYIDHINGDRADNRIANLRDVPREINARNTHKVRASSTSGLLGAYSHKRSGLWRSCLRVGGRMISLGYFKTPEEAHAAYLAGKSKHYGAEC